MLTVHHLNQSRSHRVLWALEELGLTYEIVRYQREKSMLAPDSLKKVHPLGKSPVLEDNGLVLAESGAILEYLQETYDSASRFKPLDTTHKVQYRFWLHYAEGSLMPLLLMKLVFNSLGKPPVPFGLRTLGKALGQGAYVEREVMLVKIQASGYGREEVKRNTDIFRGQIIDVTPSIYTVQLAGTSDKLDAFLASVRDVAKIVEVARSGVVGLSRGDKIMR